MELKEKVFNCNMELTLNLIGGKWKPIIIYHIGNEQPIRYGQLKRLIPTINERVLSKELRELERNNIVIRKAYDEKILRVEYSLSSIGQELLPVLNNLTEWGRNYNSRFKYASVICE